MKYLNVWVLWVALLGTIVMSCKSSEDVLPTPKSPNGGKSDITTTSLRASDIVGHWAAAEIGHMTSKGYMSGYPDGTFKPNNSLTRAEFATMIAVVLNPPKSTNASVASRNFSDISGHWAQSRILQAARAGYLSGYPDGTFKPNNQVTRVEIYAALQGGLGINNANLDLLNQYSDKMQVANWAKASVAKATEGGLVYNYPTKTQLNPTKTATRAETVCALYQMLVRAGKAPKLNNPYQASPNGTDTPPNPGVAGWPAQAQTPYFYQRANSLSPNQSCQNTTIAIALNHYKNYRFSLNDQVSSTIITPDNITQKWGKNKAQTLDGYNEVFNSEARRLGLNVRVKTYAKGTLARLNENLKQGFIVMAHGYTTSFGHVLVITGFDGTYYTCHDPYGRWNQVAYSSGYTAGFTQGKFVKYHKNAIKNAFFPDGYIWMHEIHDKDKM